MRKKKSGKWKEGEKDDITLAGRSGERRRDVEANAELLQARRSHNTLWLLLEREEVCRRNGEEGLRRDLGIGEGI